MDTQKRYSPIQKVEMLREHLDNHVSISDLSGRFNVSPAMIYYWKKQLFEGAVTLFKNNKKDQFKELQDKLKKNAIIAEIVVDNIRLKKTEWRTLTRQWVDTDIRDQIVLYVEDIATRTELKR